MKIDFDLNAWTQTSTPTQSRKNQQLHLKHFRHQLSHGLQIGMKVNRKECTVTVTVAQYNFFKLKNQPPHHV